MFRTPSGYNVDLDTARIEWKRVYSSSLRERLGKPRDITQGLLMADAVEENGRRWPCLLDVKETKAVSDKAQENARKYLEMILQGELASLQLQASR